MFGFNTRKCSARFAGLFVVFAGALVAAGCNNAQTVTERERLVDDRRTGHDRRNADDVDHALRAVRH